MTTLLLILDGWGHSEDKDYNAMHQANSPTLDKLFASSPNALVAASGGSVGLPEGQMGNSEVGHMNIGAGRVIKQHLVTINQDINNGSFLQQQRIHKSFDQACATKANIHIIGLLSAGGVHSHEDHIHALCKIAAQKKNVQIFVHVILDGRDTAPKSAISSLKKLENLLTSLKCGKISSVVGRYYAMDRDNRWDRTQSAYQLIVAGKSKYNAESSIDAVEKAYATGTTDEFVLPTTIGQAVSIHSTDHIIMMNFRSDRMRQLVTALYDDEFNDFARSGGSHKNILTLTQYYQDIANLAVYKNQIINNSLGECLAVEGKSQLRIAETEKYAHVTYFFSCGRESKFKHEDRCLIDSPKVATYDLFPQMSAQAITDKLISCINNKTYDFIVCNYANCDMVGHTGNLAAAISAVQSIDALLAQVIAALKKNQGQCFITADHGNVEEMYSVENNQPHTAHTTNLVPLIYYGDKNIVFKQGGSLCDIAPTILSAMGLKKPIDMTGTCLY